MVGFAEGNTALDAMVPLPLAPGGSVRVAEGVAFCEDGEGAGSVFLWGMAAWCWGAGDVVARRLAAVRLVESKAARQRQVAAVFGVNEDTVMLWRHAYRVGGTVGLVQRRRGPKGPSKLTDGVRDEICVLRGEGLSLRAVAGRVGLSVGTVRRALATAAPADGAAPAGGVAREPGTDLEPLAAPVQRTAPRRTRAIAALCDNLTATQTLYPGTNLTLIYTTK